MFNHYLTSALRQFRRHKITTAINIACLVIGLAALLGAHLVVVGMNASDGYFSRASDIFALTQRISVPGSDFKAPATPSTAWITGEYFRKQIPSVTVARATMADSVPAASEHNKASLQTRFADADFLRIFNFEFLAGNSQSALEAPHTIVLSEQAAINLFGSAANAVGKALTLYGSIDVNVAGVMREVRAPSHMVAGSPLAFDALVSTDVYEQNATTMPFRTSWTTPNVPTFVMVPRDGSWTLPRLTSELNAFTERNVPKEQCLCTFSAVPLNQLSMSSLNAIVGTEKTGVSATALLYLLGALILFVSCLNYANLATAQATSRAKEVGMRRVVGASRSQVITQHLFEAALQAAFALLLTLLIATLISIVKRTPNSVLWTVLTSAETWLGMIAVLVVTTSTAAAYPVFILARIRPAQVVRAGHTKAPARFVSTLLVCLQFASASFLLVFVLAMTQHDAAIRGQSTITGQDAFVGITNSTQMSGVDMQVLREELLRQPHIKGVTAYHVVPWALVTGMTIVDKSIDAKGHRTVSLNMVGKDFFSTLNMPLLAGREFDSLDVSDTRVISTNVIVDRQLTLQQGWTNPQEAIGKVIYQRSISGSNAPPTPLTIIGVVEGRSLGLIGLGATANLYQFAPRVAAFPIVRISGKGIAAGLSELDATWNELAPKVLLQRRFADELLNAAYQNFSRITRGFEALALLALSTALLGLIGMSMQAIERRMHEIGVRKTLGASIIQVQRLLLRDFSKPVLIANLIAWPLAFIGLQIYFSIFTTHVGLSIAPFLACLAITLLVAWTAVLVQATRAARMNPATVLRYE